jgi:transcriptional regulator with XRE-family HTH domain
MLGRQLTFGERLEMALKTLGLSQAQASLLTGVPQGTISHLIRNQVRMYKNSRALADGLKINHDWLVYGWGGICNPEAYYVPIIDEYFRLRLFQSEGFLEENTRFLITEKKYGKRMFASLLNNAVYICSSLDDSSCSDREMGYLLWTERRKVILDKHVHGKRVFFIHEKREYENIPDIFAK